MGSSLGCCLPPKVEQKDEKIKGAIAEDVKEIISAIDEKNFKSETWVDLRDYGIDFDKKGLVIHQKMDQKEAEKLKAEYGIDFNKNDLVIRQKIEQKEEAEKLKAEFEDDDDWSLIVNVSDSMNFNPFRNP